MWKRKVIAVKTGLKLLAMLTMQAFVWSLICNGTQPGIYLAVGEESWNMVLLKVEFGSAG